MYQQMYQAALFRMERDYLPQVMKWKSQNQQGIYRPFGYGIATGDYYDTHDLTKWQSLSVTKVYVEGPQGIPGPTGLKEPGISITRILKTKPVSM